MAQYFYIVKRENSNYTVVNNGLSWVTAMQLAEKMERDNNDGEYIVRHMFDKHDQSGCGSYQSGFDNL